MRSHSSFVRAACAAFEPGAGIWRAATFIVLALVLAAPTRAALTGASVSPTTATVAATGGTVSLRWRLQATTGAETRADSSQGTFIDPGTGGTLSRQATRLTGSGSGEIVLNETLNLTAQTVERWGVQQVRYQRSFSDVEGRSVTAAMTITVQSPTPDGPDGGDTGGDMPGEPVVDEPDPAAPPVRPTRRGLNSIRQPSAGALDIQRIELLFDQDRAIALVDRDAALLAELRVYYSGTGTLEGVWQVAEPGSVQGRPMYRNLALVRRPLSGSQRAVLDSPPLPTGLSGKYLLRFCVTNRALLPEELVRQSLDIDPSCPNPALTSELPYQVSGEADGAMAMRLHGPDGAAVGPERRFRWSEVDNAAVYQLQIFALPDTEPGLAAQAQFITGMLLPSDAMETALSPLVRAKLVPGRQYRWRVSAHNAEGRLIGRSDSAGFTWTDDD